MTIQCYELKAVLLLIPILLATFGFVRFDRERDLSLVLWYAGLFRRVS